MRSSQTLARFPYTETIQGGLMIFVAAIKPASFL